MKIFILAGGSGSRLWPLSRANYPKQFLQLTGTQSLLQNTVRRALKLLKPEDVFVLSNDKYLHDVRHQLVQVDERLKDHVIAEPVRRNTAPAVALALRYAVEKLGCGPEEVIVILPADHVIEPEELFHEALQKAAVMAAKGKIVTFGIEPTRAETGFGYIKRGSPIDEHHFGVDSFIEKPNEKKAQEYVDSGEYLWNGGMFAFSIGTMLAEMEKNCPDVHALCDQPYDDLVEDFGEFPDRSIDYGVMEKSDEVAVLPMGVNWSDVGSWENVYEMMEKDEQDTAEKGNVVSQGCKGSLIFGGKRLIVAIDMDDMLAVETDDALLLCKRGSSQKVKGVAESLLKEGRKEASDHRTVHRPWGSFTVLEEGVRYKIKRISVNPGAQLSLQKHFHRSEHWVVVKGTAEVTVDERITHVHENESIFVPMGAVHRVQNPGRVPLEIIEVQVGEYLGEDDIVRLEDRYGRA